MFLRLFQSWVWNIICISSPSFVISIFFCLQSEYDEFISSGLYLVVLLHFCEQRFSDVLGAVDGAGVRTHTLTRASINVVELMPMLKYYRSHFLKKIILSPPFSPSYSTCWEFFMNTWTILKVCFSYLCVKEVPMEEFLKATHEGKKWGSRFFQSQKIDFFFFFLKPT